jgi:hypothetical protein
MDHPNQPSMCQTDRARDLLAPNRALTPRASRPSPSLRSSTPLVVAALIERASHHYHSISMSDRATPTCRRSILSSGAHHVDEQQRIQVEVEHDEIIKMADSL